LQSWLTLKHHLPSVYISLSTAIWIVQQLTIVGIFLRLHGDLIYIDVVTLEGNKCCITGSSKSFYVNASNGSILDSRPLKQSHEASTLVGLLQNISAKFKKGFVITLKFYLTLMPLSSISFLMVTIGQIL
jgi:hypothetical protein